VKREGAWQILTGEYPPQPGGVSDYTKLVADGLAASGADVTVWAPPCEGGSTSTDARVTVRRLPDCFGPRSLRAIDAHLRTLPAPRRLLVQYVPHAFGWKGANIRFAAWLYRRRRESVWIMFHEVLFPMSRAQSVAQNGLGAATRAMAALVNGAAERRMVAIPAWERLLAPLGNARAPIDWVPMPSTIPVVIDREGVDAVRQKYAPGRPLVGHFGTDGSLIRTLLLDAVVSLAGRSDCAVLLIGRGSAEARRRIVASAPSLEGRIHATGPLAPDDVSRHMSACDLMLQPFPDGVSTRRTSVMAALAHEKPVATTTGALTEDWWHNSDVGVFAPAGDATALAKAAADLLHDAPRLHSLGACGRDTYDHRFDLRHTLAALRREPRAPRHAALSSDFHPALSIVIPTFNNVAVLTRCLDAWQTYAADQPVELIVIEDGCGDGTSQYLAAACETPWGRRHLRWFHEAGLHELRCTNRGLREARAPLAMAWQDDMFVACRWLVPELIASFSSYGDLGLLSLSRGLDCHPCADPVRAWEDLVDERRLTSTIGGRPLNWLRLQEVDAVIRPWVVRTSCLDAVGLLDEAFVPTEWDEADLAFRIRAAGWRVATHGYERAGAYTHLGSTTISKSFSDQYKAGVLRNGTLFYDRWRAAIAAESSRRRRVWWRRASPAGLRQTAKRLCDTARSRG
jgi:glycosyltransferase involved in cell wall biosynthesis/GT2 family glycosyltransferase